VLHRSNRPVFCAFDPRKAGDVSAEAEFIEPSHPLIQWIRARYQGEQDLLHRVVAIRLDEKDAEVPAGLYVFSAQRWSFEGLKSDQLLTFRALNLTTGRSYGAAESEALITAASRFGHVLQNALNVLPGLPEICEAAVRCEEALADAFGERLSDFEAENKVRCDQQKTSAEKLARRRLEGFHGRIEKFRREGNLRPIPMTEGLIRKEEEQLSTKLERIANRQQVDPTMISLATGAIKVEKDIYGLAR
jgi:hypothetical protein